MRNNLEKWNHYLSIVNKKTNDFFESQKEGKFIPNIYYVVLPSGTVGERTITGIEYSHYKHGGRIYFSGNKPTKKEVEALSKYSEIDIPFSVDNLWFKYFEFFGEGNKYRASSSVSFSDVIKQKGLYHSIKDADNQANTVKKNNEEAKAFQELHKKDRNYNYEENGYKFLGWQNGWNHVYYDEDGNLCSETGKPHKSFGYKKEDYPEYKNCIDSKHKRIEVSLSQRGSENIVSCPSCKIYWKYDCSD